MEFGLVIFVPHISFLWCSERRASFLDCDISTESSLIVLYYPRLHMFTEGASDRPTTQIKHFVLCRMIKLTDGR